MKPRFGSSLKTRIAAVAGALFLIGIGLITLFVTRILHDEMQEMVSKQQIATTSYIARDIDAKIQLRLDSLERVAGNIPPELFSNAEHLQAWLDDRRAIHNLFPIGLMVIPPDGGPTLADTPRLKNRPKSFADRDWFIGAVSTGQAFISKPLIARAINQPALVVAVPIFDAQRKLLGVLAGVTPLLTPGFLDLIVDVRPSKQGAYELLAPKHGLYVLSSDIETAVTALPVTGLDPVVDQALAGARGIKVMRNAAGEEELVALVEATVPGWLLLARLPASEAFDPVRNAQRNTLLIAVLVGLPLIVLLLAALNRQLQPLAGLARELHDMADDRRPMQPLPAQVTEEVADVANSFNRLQRKLLEQEKRLAEMAHHDTLTGLPNRLLITDRLEKELLRIRRSGLGLALLFLDLDGFKPVNDEYGHQVGDLVLIQIAGRLQSCLRDVDTIARLGGDEFLILLSDTDLPVEAAERVARNCLAALQMPILVGDLKLSVGVSIGITVCDAPAALQLTAKQVVSRADQAMYQAKAGGRNRYVIHAADPIHETS
jgi:diguanylate cyclase